MSLPNLFLVAAPRSGSTQLARWLDSHQEISLSMVKEPNFFAADDFPPDYATRSHLDDVPPTGPPRRPAQFAVFRDEAAYRSLFCGLESRWRLDASTSYLANPSAAGRIAETVPDARIILLIRDPVRRALSHYGLALRTGRTRRSLTEELDEELSGALPPGAQYLLRPSRTAKGVARFRQAFPDDHLLALSFEELFEEPRRHIGRIARFLDIDDRFDLSRTARNASATARFPGLNAWLHRSGIKTAIRRSAPAPLRPMLRRLWFTDPGTPIASSQEIARLRRLLEVG